MNIFLTIDVESYTGDHEREIWGGGHGLGYILAQCCAYGVRATFFVEALGATRWGFDPLRMVCQRILAAGQEIQLHVHPVVARLDGFEDHQDVLWMHDGATQERLLAEGRRILKECGVPDISAFRAGDFAANADTLRAMESLGLLLGSNRDPDLKCSTRSRINDVFPVSNDLSRVGDVVDLPLTVFRSGLPCLDGPYRHMEISAVGLDEMTDIIEGMERGGYSCVTILTHPGEFFRWAGSEAVPIAKNCRRLEGLLAFLRQRKELLVLTLSQCLGNTVMPVRSPPEVSPLLASSLRRVGEQGLERMRT